MHAPQLTFVMIAMQISVLFVFAGLFATGLYGCMKVEEGLDLTDVVPRRSQEHKFVEAQFKYFSFHQMFVITKGDFDYPNSQELLYKLHEAFKKVRAKQKQILKCRNNFIDWQNLSFRLR